MALLVAFVGFAMAIYLVSVRGAPTRRSANVEEQSMAQATNPGIIERRSHHSVDETVGRLKTLLQSRSIMLFGLIDHSGEAEKVGIKMPPTKLLIFGNPKAGTPVMLAAPSIALDLPLKILIREDGQGRVWVSYNSPAYLQGRHGCAAGAAAKYRSRRSAGSQGRGVERATFPRSATRRHARRRVG